MWNEMLPVIRAVQDLNVQLNGESRHACALERTAENLDAEIHLDYVCVLHLY